MRITPEQLTSRDNERVKYAQKLMEKPAFCKAEQRFLAEGKKLCLDAAESGIVIEILYYTYMAQKRWPEIDSLPGEHISISESVAEKISGMKSAQGVFAVCRLPVWDEAQVDPTGRYIALENVQDPANVGAVLRSAAAFGFDGALLSQGCAEPFGQKALRASMGAAFKLPIIRTLDLPAALRVCSAKGMSTAAAALRGAVDLSEFKPQGGLVLAIGNEGNGLTDDAIDACEKAVKIPISERMESLNAAVAASVLMWEFRSLC